MQLQQNWGFSIFAINFFIAGGSANLYNHPGNQLGSFSEKLETVLPQDPDKQLLGI